MRLWLAGALLAVGCQAATSGLPHYPGADYQPMQVVENAAPGTLDLTASMPEPVPTSGEMGRIAERYRYKGPVARVRIEDADTEDKLAQVGQFFAQQLGPDWKRLSDSETLICFSRGGVDWGPSSQQLQIPDVRRPGGLVLLTVSEGKTVIREVNVEPAGEVK